MPSDPKPVSVINAEELVRRIQQAKSMRGEGRPEEDIRAIEPSPEEVRDALNELRGTNREAINAGMKKRSTKKQPKSLDDLLGGTI